MGGKKKTKQDEINNLRLERASLLKDLEKANSRKAELAEEKHALEERVRYLDKKYEKTFEELMVTRHNFDSSQAAMAHWYKQAIDTQKEILMRGFRRAQYDHEFAIIRELIHSNGKLSAEQVIEASKRYPKADLRRMVSVAMEFNLHLKFDVVSKELKKAPTGLAEEIEADLFTFSDKDGKWKAEVNIKNVFALDQEKANGDQKD
jgi:chromosome segregation ATPase